MVRESDTQRSLFYNLSLEGFVPVDHSLRQILLGIGVEVFRPSASEVEGCRALLIDAHLSVR
jgi:hypothetical protein